MDSLAEGNRVTLGATGSGIAEFKDPVDIFVDGAGRIYVIDLDNNRLVRADDMSGSGWTTMPIEAKRSCQISAGTTWSIQLASGVFVDAAGRIYLLGNNQITRVDDMTGAGRVVFGSRVRSGARQFDEPIGIFVDPSGRIYVTDGGNHRVVRMDDMSGRGWVALGTWGCGQKQFWSPQGIAVDAKGRIYVADSANDWIARMDDMTGAGWVTFGREGGGPKEFNFPTGIAVDARGRIYVSDTGNNRVVRMDDMTGAGWKALGSEGPLSKRLGLPGGIAVDATGRVYVADVIGRVVRFTDMDATGWFATWLRRPDRELSLSDLGPIGIAVDASGRIYLTDWATDRIGRMDSLSRTGFVTLGGPGRGASQCASPTGIFVH